MNPILPPIGNSYMVYTALVFCVVSILIVMLYVLPLQFRQAKVRNGLAKMRKLLLLAGADIVAANTIVAYFITIISSRTLETGRHLGTAFQLLLLSLCFFKFALACILYVLYHQQYTPEHIAQSNKLADLTEAKHKREDKKPHKK